MFSLNTTKIGYLERGRGGLCCQGATGMVVFKLFLFLWRYRFHFFFIKIFNAIIYYFFDIFLFGSIRVSRPILSNQYGGVPRKRSGNNAVYNGRGKTRTITKRHW